MKKTKVKVIILKPENPNVHSISFQRQTFCNRHQFYSSFKIPSESHNVKYHR